MSDVWYEIIKESWENVRSLAVKQLDCGLDPPFRKLGDEAWITAELYHQLKVTMNNRELMSSSADLFISTELKLNQKSVDLGITSIDCESKSRTYILLLELKHSTPWHLLNWKRNGIKKKDYTKKYENKDNLSLEEILLPNISYTSGSNLLKDLYRLNTIIEKLPKNSVKVVGLA